MTLTHATWANGEIVTPASLKSSLLSVLMYAPKGISEPMLVQLVKMHDPVVPIPLPKWAAAGRVSETDPWLPKIHRALRLIGARKVDKGDGKVWFLPQEKHVDLNAQEYVAGQQGGRTWTEPQIIQVMIDHFTKHGRWPAHDSWKAATPETPSTSCRILRGRWKKVLNEAKAEYARRQEPVAA
jgi:hypothetical protein